jgi:phosphoglycolate phosphatase
LRAGAARTRFSLIAFDLDGTLVDSRRDIADAANQLLESCGASRLPEEIVGGMVGDGAAVLVARAFERAGVQAPGDALERFLEIYSSRLLVHTRPYPGVSDVLAALTGQTALALLTNKPYGPTLEILKGLDLEKYFDGGTIVGGDSGFSRKPDPAGLLHLCGQAAADPAASLLVGDSLVDWHTARNAGTELCVARYGFGFATFSSEGSERALNWTIDAPVDLLSL